MDFEAQEQGEVDEIMAPREDLLGYDDEELAEDDIDVHSVLHEGQTQQAADEEEANFRSNTGREAAAASSRRADKREKDRQPISWQDWAKHAKPGDASQQESERPKRSREQSPQHRHIDRTDERGGMRVVIPHPSDTRTLHRRPSEGHPRGRSPRRHSYSPVDRRAVYRSHSSREVAPYPSGGFEPRSAAALPPRPSDRAPGSAWPELYDSAPRRDPVRRSHSECAPLRAEIPWDGHEYDRHYAPSSHPSVSYPYPEPDYPAPTYRQAPIRHSDPREHPYAQSHLEADYRQPLYPSREPHRDRSHSYSRAVEVVHEPYVQPQPAWDILRNDGYDLQKHPPAHHDADDRWHDVQPDRASLHAAPRAPRQAPHHAPRYPSTSRALPSSRHSEDSRPASRYVDDLRPALRYTEEPRHVLRAMEEPTAGPRYAEPARPLPRHAEESRRAPGYTSRPEDPPRNGGKDKHAARYADTDRRAPPYADDHVPAHRLPQRNDRAVDRDRGHWDERAAETSRHDRSARPSSRDQDRHRPSRPAPDVKLDDRHKHQHALADRSHGHQEPRPHKQERERDAHHSRPARDIPSRTARLEASRNKAADPDDKAPNKAADKAADQAKPQELPPPPTKSADDKQERQAKSVKSSRHEDPVAQQEPVQTDAPEHKGDSSPELNVEQGFLTAANSPEKSQRDGQAQQANTEKDAADSSKHAQRDKHAQHEKHAQLEKHARQKHATSSSQHQSRDAKRLSTSAKGEEPGNRYMEDRRRREAAAAKLVKPETKARGEGASQSAERPSSVVKDGQASGQGGSKEARESSRPKVKADQTPKSPSVPKTTTTSKNTSPSAAKVSGSKRPAPSTAKTDDAHKAKVAKTDTTAKETASAAAKTSVKDQASMKDKSSAKADDADKARPAAKGEGSSRASDKAGGSGSARLTGQKRRERSPARSASPKRKITSPSNRTSGKAAEKKEKKEALEELPMPPARQSGVSAQSSLPPPPARGPAQKEQEQHANGLDAIEPGEVLLPPPPPKPLPKAVDNAKHSARDRQSKAAVTDEKHIKADKSKAASPQQQKSERSSGKSASETAMTKASEKVKESGKQAARDSGRHKQEPPVASTTKPQSSKAADTKDKETRSQKPANGKQSQPQKAEVAKDSKAKKDVLEKPSRERSRSRSPAKVKGSSQLNGKDSRSKRTSPDGTKPAKSSQQGRGASDKESRLEWMYSDNRKTHGPSSLLKLREVVKTLEQDKQKHKAYEFLRLTVWRHGDTRRTLQIRDVV